MNEAIAAVDPAKAADLWHEVQVQQFQSGGQLGWGHNDSLDLVAANVNGLRAGPSISLDSYRLLTASIA